MPSLSSLSSLTVILALSIFPFQQSRADEGDFAKHKAEMLTRIDERMQKLQEHKTCVSGAADREGLKKCRMSMKEWHKGEMMERMEHKKEKLKGKMEKLKGKMGESEKENE